MNIGNKRSTRGKKKSTGYIVAVLMCVAAVGLVAWSTELSSRRLESTADSVSVSDLAFLSDAELAQSDSLMPVEEQDFADPDEPAMEISAPVQQPQEVQTMSNDTEAQTAETEPAEPKVVEAAVKVKNKKPVSGSLLKGFSGDELVFCETLGDWRVHSGIDIKCKQGAKVVSASAGTVQSVAKDDKFGTVVIVLHPDDTLVYYCGLASDVSVSKGEAVSPGQKLGRVGDIPCEISDSTHLHLAVIKAGEFVDPMKALSITYK